MKYKFDFSREKSAVLKEARGLGFEEIILAIESGSLVDNKRHPNQKRYPGQELFIVKVKGYIYAVPYLVDRERQIYFLKTLYPSRKLKKEYDKK